MKIVKYPLSTEKSIRLMQAENTLVFVVEKKAKRKEVRDTIEQLFKAKVAKVNLYNSVSGEKRAYVKFSAETPAIDIATQLGLM